LLAPWKHEETAMIGGVADRLPAGSIDARVAALRERIATQARGDAIDAATVTIAATLDLRYRGQGHQIPVPYGDDGIDAALEAFHAAHKRAFGYDRRDEAVEIVLVRVAGTGPAPIDRLPLPEIETGADPLIARSPLFLDGAFVEVPVYDRARLAPGTTLTGPLIVEQQDTTLILGPQTMTVDAFGGITIGMKP